VRRADTYPVAFRVGELSGGLSERAESLAELLNDVADTRPIANLTGERWAKLGTNCMVNALSGLSGYTASEVRSRDDTLAVMLQLGAETINVARARGVEVALVMGIDPQRFVDAAGGVGTDSLVDDLRIVAKSAGGHRASMLQDVLKGRRTEIEDLNGFIAREGRELGIPTPFNAAAAEVVRGYPVGSIVATPENFDRLLALATA
jgi:2-dehydropantoate 2-reductase